MRILSSIRVPRRARMVGPGKRPLYPATVVDNRGNERDDGAVFTDGPFIESKEYLAGFWIIEAPDLDVVLRLAAEGSKACNRKIEVRPFL